ncbi:MAG: sugar ABC transporter ATP-binding protein, partial [Spirochaetaceae bacterium]|nr:sugar ABC transporter ATP-binding protein [Spirochaetaceae bacterium]
STLIKILGGIYSADQGEIAIEGEPVRISHVSDARNAGIRIIHQELALVPYISIGENVFLGNEPVKGGFVDFDSIYRETQKMLDSFGIKRRAEEEISRLNVAEQQLVEIIRAVSFNAKIIVMDEPTSSLSDRECDTLFEKIRFLKSQGIGVLYISHRMSELPQIADRVTVLRDGQYIATKNIGETTMDELISLMVGRSITAVFNRDYCASDEVLLEVRNLSTDYIHGVSFKLRRGEILGFSGLVGAGRTETMRALAGIDPIRGGQIFLEGREIHFKDAAGAMGYGFSLVPEDRRTFGIFPEQQVDFNITLKVLDEFIRGIFVDKQREQEISREYFDELAVKAPSMETHLANLSGGNQQKVVVASWLATRPKILIFDEPTRGIDVGAKSEIYGIMNRLAKGGISIIMVSSELPEILNMSDRIAVMGNNTLAGILDRREATQESIMKLAVI